MQTSVRQVTDSIHGTIYISELEHEMMSTPFFYRLHDVYQSSTVYMTFPSNRTKRYEHSLGTMELASRMFYSAITNTEKTKQIEFLNQLCNQFEGILSVLKNRAVLSNIRFYQSNADFLSEIIPKTSCSRDAFNDLLQKLFIQENPLFDHALCQQDVCFFELIDTEKNPDELRNEFRKIPFFKYIYQCTLEAVRIAALFHDIGHPPFSHIIERTLETLYNKLPSEHFIEEKALNFKQSLNKYINCSAVEPMILDQIKGNKSIIDPALHEQIGLDILYNAFRSVLNRFAKEWASKKKDKKTRLSVMYYITIVEFTIGILLEKAPIFKTLHSLISGPVDADRMDYIVRDSHNAGVDWGTIPYQRIISSVKFITNDDEFYIAFPEKVTDDIDDLIVNRYKIFQRINFHHKSVRTSELLQRSVEILADDYLSSEEGMEINPEIKYLWECLSSAFGQNEVENQISKWTDSWLVSVLSNTLIRLSDSDEREKLCKGASYRSEQYLTNLLVMLEEVLLTRKRFFPLLKRHRNALALRDKILKAADITTEGLQKVASHEYHCLIQKTDEESRSAQESLYRINIFQDKVLAVADLDLLDIIFSSGVPCSKRIEEVLQEKLLDGIIENFFVCKNAGFKNPGISATDRIYLYRGDNNYLYDFSTTLTRKLLAQRAGCLWLFVYVCFPKLPEEEISMRIDKLNDDIAEAIGKNLKITVNELLNYQTITEAE